MLLPRQRWKAGQSGPAAPLQLAWSVTELRGRRRRPPDRTRMIRAAGTTMFAHLTRARAQRHVCASRARARRSRLAAQLAWPAELRGRGRRPPDRDSMMVAFGRVLALDFGLARWCSLSLGAWLPSAAPDHGRAGRGRFSFLRIWVAAQPSSCCRDPPRRMMQYGAADSILMLSGGGLAGAAASVNA